MKQGEVMTFLSRYPLSQCQQALLAALDGSALTLLTENTSVEGKLGSPDELAARIVSPKTSGESPNRAI